MSASCRRLTAGVRVPMVARQVLGASEISRLCGVGMNRRKGIVLRGRRLVVAEAEAMGRGGVRVRSDGGGEERMEKWSYGSEDRRRGDLVVVEEKEDVGCASGGCEGDRRMKVVIAAAFTVVLGVGNRVLYKLALVPLKHYPFFLAQLATVGYFSLCIPFSITLLITLHILWMISSKDSNNYHFRLFQWFFFGVKSKLGMNEHVLSISSYFSNFC